MIKQIFFKTIISLTTIILCLFVAEYYVKLNFPYKRELFEIVKDSVDEKILFELKPNAKTTFTGMYAHLPPTSIEISSQGIRDYEYHKEKPQDTYRIIILGDSIGFGWGVDIEDTFAKKLERMIQKTNSKKYEVINFSCPGYNITQKVATLEKKCLIYSPDLVIFSLTDNDYFPLYNYRRPLPKWISVYIPDFLYKSFFFRWILEKIVLNMDKKRKGEFYTGTLEIDLAMKKLQAIIEKYQIKALFYPDIEWLVTILKKYDLCDYIITSDGVLWKTNGYTFENDGHPNVLGHEKIAKEIYRYLWDNGYINVFKNIK